MAVKVSHFLIRRLTRSCTSIKSVKGRPLSYPLKQYVEVVCYVVLNGIKWSVLEDIRWAKCHYSAYYRFFQKMCNADVFEAAHRDFMKGRRLDKSQFFIDTTNVRNKRGSDSLELLHKAVQFSLNV